MQVFLTGVIPVSQGSAKTFTFARGRRGTNERTMLSVKELAVELGMSADSVYRAYRKGEISARGKSARLRGSRREDT